MSKTASPSDRAYFARVAQANLLLNDETIPDSLDEMFDRLEHIRQTLGVWALPGIPPMERGDVTRDQDAAAQDSHLRFLTHVRRVLNRGTQRP